MMYNVWSTFQSATPPYMVCLSSRAWKHSELFFPEGMPTITISITITITITNNG